MGALKIRIKTKDCTLNVRVKAGFGNGFDEEKLEVFCKTCSRGFLKPQVVKKHVVEYTGPIGVSLYERCGQPMGKREFLFILEQIVIALQKIRSNHLDVNALLLDLHHVFINRSTREVWFLYAPTVKSGGETDVRGFIESLVYSLKPDEKDDQEFVSRFMCFFRGMKEVSLERMEQFIGGEDGSVVRLIRKQTGGQSGFITDKIQHYVEHYQGKEADADPVAQEDEATGLLQEEGWQEDEATGLLQEEGWQDDEATGLLQEEGWQEDEATGLLQEEGWQDDEATGLLREQDAGCDGGGEEPDPAQQQGEGGTALLCEDSIQDGCHTLYRLSNEERIPINKPVYRLGKEKSYVDYFVTNNVAVSRSHADIISRGDKCFVRDLNSKNHTYLNGEMIPANCEVELRHEDRLRLGNEEFIFYQ